MGGLLHLTKRFFGAVRPGAPRPEDEAWARSSLLPGERLVWERMNNPDRRHAVAVARASVAEFERRGLPHGDQRPVVAAALLHDSGKVLAELRTPARVAATLYWAVADDTIADRWLEQPTGPVKRKLAQYRRHPELGAAMLRDAGADAVTCDWAAQHHLPEHRWTVPMEVGAVLKLCDDD